MFKYLRKIQLLLAILLLQITYGETAQAQFSQGNLVVLKVGSGLAAPTSGANAISLVEYTTAGAATGSSLALPSTGTPQITVSGTATSEGLISLSAERDRIMVAGYDAAAGLTSVASSTAAAVNREIFAVTAAGTYSKVASSTTAYTGNNIRGATANGTNYYSSGPSIGNVLLNSSLQLSTVSTNTRVIQIFNGQLYFSASSGAFLGVSSMGTGVPVTNNQPATLLAGSASAYGFSISPDGNTMYVADDGLGIAKYTFNGTTFTLAYNVTTTQARGLTVDYSTTPSTIYATTIEATSNRIIKVQDNGVASATTTLATAPVNTIFRGIVWSPVACPTVTANTVTNVSCNGGNNGSANTIVTGGQSPFTYAWSGPSGYTATTANISNAAAGTYTVSVSSASGCTVTATTTVTEPAVLAATVTPTNILCNGSSTGAITSTVTGGTPTYTYTWSGPAGYSSTSQNISNIAAGNYSLTVTDNHSCTVTQTTTVTQPTAIAVSVLTTSVSCFGSATGSATVTVTGGTPGYTYSWAPSGGTDAVASDLTANTYTCTVTDANTCTVTATATVTQPTQLTATISETDVTCNGGATGSATVTPTGGTSGYTYSWAPSGGNNATASNLAAGTYTCTITDANSCSINVTVMVNEPAAMTASIDASANVCAGASTVVTFTATPNTTITYDVDGGAGQTINIDGSGVATLTATPVATTTYNLENIQDNGGVCTQIVSGSVMITVIAITTPTIVITANPGVVISPGTPVTFTANASGGGTITYQWEKNGTVVSGATNSTYTDNGLADNDNIFCIAYTDAPCATVDSALSDTLTISVLSCAAPTPVTAANITETSADISWPAVGGIMNYEYAMDYSPIPPVAGTTINATTYHVTGLVADSNYYFHVRSNCGSSFSIWSSVEFFTPHSHLGIGNVANNASGFDVNVYPNPAKDNIYVQVTGMQGNANIVITDLTGKVVKVMNFAGNTLNIDMSIMANGTYILRYNDDKQVKTLKVTKQ